MPTLFDPQAPATRRREPADLASCRRPWDESAGSRRPLAPADFEMPVALPAGVLCFQQWLDLNA